MISPHQLARGLETGSDTGLHLSDGLVDRGDGLIAIAALVVLGHFKLSPRGAQIIERVVHVRLGGMHIRDEHAAGKEDSEGERNEEMSEVEFHDLKMN